MIKQLPGVRLGLTLCGESDSEFPKAVLRVLHIDHVPNIMRTSGLLSTEVLS